MSGIIAKYVFALKNRKTSVLLPTVLVVSFIIGAIVLAIAKPYYVGKEEDEDTIDAARLFGFAFAIALGWTLLSFFFSSSMKCSCPTMPSLTSGKGVKEALGL